MLPSKKSVLLLGLLPALSMAVPPSLDIGTFAIDNYVANGGGLPNLTFMIASGQNVFAGANANVPAYNSALASGGGGPSLPVDNRDWQVNKASIISTSTLYGSREYCDFIYYGGHGLGGGLYLGAAAGYGGVIPSELGFGKGYNRWFLANACNLFNAGEPATTWAPAFKGLKAMLAFKSVVFDNNQSWQLYHEFWLNWTWREKNLANSWFDAQTNYGYAHMYPAAGLEPGCLSAQVPSGRNDHCSESYKAVERNYNKAIENSGLYYSRVIGSPIY